ncbi:MAG: pyroglutamyl-peptidase I [Ruminococcaceae bacterium]|nr:pyroglutamyl-peptidase I [Oscillospiraceae bacterium]
MKILVTGFDPFGGESVNPALELIKQLPKEIEGCEIITQEVPTVFHKSIQVIKAAIDLHHPDAVLSIGQAGGRPDMTVERVGINCDDARIPDNEGNSPVDAKIFEDGDDAYLLTLPIKAMVKEIQAAGIPASVSNTAGTFVCNHVAYGVAYLARKYYPEMKTGFMHIPYLPYQAADKRGVASMSLESLKTGTIAAIKAIIANEKDIEMAFGSEH